MLVKKMAVKKNQPVNHTGCRAKRMHTFNKLVAHNAQCSGDSCFQSFLITQHSQGLCSRKTGNFESHFRPLIIIRS